MSDLYPMSDLVADDLLLDRLAGRVEAGNEPVAGLLSALAAHADTPLPARTGRRKVGNKHRYIGAFAALAVAASGAGVAAAVSLPDRGLSEADRIRIEHKMEENARSDAPSVLLSRLGLPQTSGTTEARGLVLMRRPDGTIVLMPASVVAASGYNGLALGAGGGNGQGSPDAPGGNAYGAAQGGNPQGGTPQTGNGQGDQGSGQPEDEQTPSPRGTGDDGTGGTGGKGGDKKKNAVSPTPTPTPTASPTTDTMASVAPSTGAGARAQGGSSPRSAGPATPPLPPRTGGSAANATTNQTPATSPTTSAIEGPIDSSVDNTNAP